LLLLIVAAGCRPTATEDKRDAVQPVVPTGIGQWQAFPNPSPCTVAEEPRDAQINEVNPRVGKGETDSCDHSSGEPLLLLDEPEDNEGDESMGRNARCLVCHLNYQLEDIALVHAKAGYGCAHCHGESDAHIADESWASGGNGTAPDIMYRPDEVIPACLKCHDLSKSDPECHCEFPRLSQKKLCTDCHGDHRLKDRKCHWK